MLTEEENRKLQTVIADLRTNGWPEGAGLEDAFPHLTEPQRELLIQLTAVVEKERLADESLEREIVPQSGKWVARNAIREHMQRCIAAGLSHLGILQRNAVLYGAVPDPKDGWKYYLQPNNLYACWECGGGVSVKTQRLSVHIRGIALAGTGKVITKQCPYCPMCEIEPASSGFIYEDQVEDPDFARLMRMSRARN